MSWKGPSTSEVQRINEEQDRMDHNFSKLQRLIESVKSRPKSSGTFAQDSIRCSSMVKSEIYCTDWEKHQKFSQDEFYLLMSMFRDITCGTKDKKKNVWHTLESYLCMQGSLVQDNGHSLVLVLKEVVLYQ